MTPLIGWLLMKNNNSDSMITGTNIADDGPRRWHENNVTDKSAGGDENNKDNDDSIGNNSGNYDNENSSDGAKNTDNYVWDSN